MRPTFEKKRRAANKTIKKISRIKLCLRVASFISTVVAVIVAVNVAVIFTIVVIVAIIWLISLLLELAGGFVEKRLSLLKTAFIMDVTPEAVENKIIHPIDKERVLKIAEKYQKQKDKKKKAKMV